MTSTQRRRSRQLSLSALLMIAFVMLVALSAGAIISLTYSLNTRILLAVANSDFDRTALSTIDNTEYLLQPVSVAVDQGVVTLEDSDILTRERSLLRHLYEIVVLYPQSYAAYVALQSSGDFFQVQRIPPGARQWGPYKSPLRPGAKYVLRTILAREGKRVEQYRYVSDFDTVVAVETVETPTYDPRVRPFYEAAWGTAERILTDIYTFASNGKPGVTIARKFSRSGEATGVIGVDITLESLSRFLRAQPVGQNGLALIVSDTGQIVAAPEDALSSVSRDVNGGFTVSGMGRPEVGAAWAGYLDHKQQRFSFTANGRDYLAAFRPFPPRFDKSWIIMEVAPVDDFIGTLQSTVRWLVIFSAGIAVLVILGSVVLARGVTKPIARVVAESDRIRTLNFEGGVAGRSRISEIQQLIDSMAAMKTAIRTLAADKTDPAAMATLMASVGADNPHSELFRKVAGIMEARHAQAVEMDLAAEIQQSVLPRDGQSNLAGGATIAARMRAARDVGGDFYDWLWRDEDRLIFMVGDVSGKGVPAAFFMAITRTAIRSMVAAGATVPAALEATNALLAQSNERCFFVTLFIGELNVRTGVLSFINAGHDLAFVIRNTEGRKRLRSQGPALGVIEDAKYQMTSVSIAQGGSVLVMTDGVTDAIDADSKEFGMERLESLLDDAAARRLQPSEAVDGIISAVDEFADKAEQFDDITCLAISYKMAQSPVGETLAAAGQDAPV